MLAQLSSPRARRVALGLAVGAVGGVLFDLAGAPLAYMLGALAFTMVASLAGAPIAASNRLRAAFLVVIGLFLGEAFTADLAERATAWPTSLALAAAYGPIGAALGFFVYWRLARADPATSMLSAIPGGLSAIVAMAQDSGADDRAVAVAQALRVALVVAMAPVVFFGLLGYAPIEHGGGHAAAPSNAAGLLDLTILSATAVAGVLAFQRLGAPMPYLLAPLLTSAALRIGGVVSGDLPDVLVEAALVVVGSATGARFAGVALAAIARIAGWTIAATVVLCMLSALFGAAASAATGADIVAALLAFAPGGVAEMALIAIALDADPAFVAAHHLVRIAVIVLAAPLLAALVSRPRRDAL